MPYSSISLFDFLVFLVIQIYTPSKKCYSFSVGPPKSYTLLLVVLLLTFTLLYINKFAIDWTTPRNPYFTHKHTQPFY